VRARSAGAFPGLLVVTSGMVQPKDRSLVAIQGPLYPPQAQMFNGRLEFDAVMRPEFTNVLLTARKPAVVEA